MTLERSVPNAVFIKPVYLQVLLHFVHVTKLWNWRRTAGFSAPFVTGAMRTFVGLLPSKKGKGLNRQLRRELFSTPLVQLVTFCAFHFPLHILCLHKGRGGLWLYTLHSSSLLLFSLAEHACWLSRLKEVVPSSELSSGDSKRKYISEEVSEDKHEVTSTETGQKPQSRHYLFFQCKLSSEPRCSYSRTLNMLQKADSARSFLTKGSWIFGLGQKVL